ncbi:telomerase RNA component interacting RNase-like [Actinia tenebrosa]|uniref:Telomerase RNA component interacting RNase-like n=1 Tax=Actinia tenebrosa TaxID=6105 RepID=A0A6P8HF61_ACTTE|nr:telomerase RNA component interacting RNase-like [Actinia tenebrosa]
MVFKTFGFPVAGYQSRPGKSSTESRLIEAIASNKMAAKRIDCGSSSFLSLNSTDKEPSNTASLPMNTFANDGSFFEQYKKRMEEMEKAKTLAQTSSKEEKDGDERTSDDNKLEDKKSEDKPKTPVLKANLLNQGKRQLLTGRMGGASKQFHAKKKKLEKQAAEKKNDKSKDDGKNTAWKAYMEEVKKYREASCTEEVDRVRPLVK